jgi:ferredoxin/flavodoxin---NADP+ reductase
LNLDGERLQTFKVVIVGAGPAGYFTAQALQNAQTDQLSFQIDMIERLPTPWGLVRSGVAPDHPKIKTVTKVFEKIAKESNFRLFANVEVGKDVSIKELREKYDAVVLSTGSPVGKKLAIPGEDLANCLSAAEFVPWYNSHPDFSDLEINFDCDTALVIGAGNVAMDVARMLALDPTELDLTDIAEHALTKLHQSKIRNVIICGRRGPEHAAFTAPELRDLLKLKHTDVYIDSTEIKKSQARVETLTEVEKELRNNLEAMRGIAELEKKGVDRMLEIKFLATPIEIRGNAKVEEVVFEINRVEADDKITSTEKTFTIKCGLVVSAIGYEVGEFAGVPIENGKIKNIRGHVAHNVYVVGWAKRGPVGVIGTNKSDAVDVVDLLISELNKPKGGNDITDLLNSGHEVIDQSGWEKINASEILSGELSGKPRIKEVDWRRLINLGRA